MIERRAVSLLVLLSGWFSPVLAQVSKPAAEDPLRRPDYRIELQLEELRDRVTALKSVASPSGAAARLEPARGALDRARLWQRALARGRVLRAEPQIHLFLSVLRSDLQRIADDLGVPSKAAPRAPTTATISGRVTGSDLAPPAGLDGVWVEIFDESNAWVETVQTDLDGDYTSSPLPDGTYFAKTLNLEVYVDELYDDIPCHNICDIAAQGTPLTITAGSSISGIDFDLDPGGTLSGTITDVDGGAPLEGIIVDLFDTSGEWVSNTATGTDGTYVSLGLPAGSYYASTWNDLHYLNELYDDIACPFHCDPISEGGALIAVSVGADSAGNDFALALGGWISGNIVETGASALADVVVEVFDSSGQGAGWGITDGSGDYRSNAGLPTGTYFAKTLAPPPFLDELYDDLHCLWCDPTSGTAIAVIEAVESGGVDFALDRGGMISGTVIDADSTQGIAGVWVEIFDLGGLHVGSALTASGGVYTSQALAAGTYFARTWNDLGYVNELYQELACPFGCDPISGTPIPVIADTTVILIDFTLDAGATIAGTVTDGTTGLVGVEVQIYDSDGEFRASSSTSAAGDYTTIGLPAGNYYAKAWNSLGYLNEVFDDLPCPNWCDVTSGTVIAVTAGEVVLGIDFDLDQGALVTGRVTAEPSGLPIENLFVDFFDQSGTHVSHGFTDATGNYQTYYALVPGTYFAKTWNDLGYLDELFQDLSCHFGCDVTGGTPIVVTAGATIGDIDFSLIAGGFVSGVATEAGDLPLAGVEIRIHNSSGVFLTSAVTDAFGAYGTWSLPAGHYFLSTSALAGYVHEVYDDIPCVGCDVTRGRPVYVAGGGTTTGIDFELAPGGLISGTLTEEGSGLGIPRIRVNIHASDGTFLQSFLPDENGDYVTPEALPTGSYYLVTYTMWGEGPRYVNELYDGLPCLGECDVTAGTPVSVVAGSTTSGIDFVLALGGQISGTVTETGSGTPIEASTVMLYDATGSLMTVANVNGVGEYTSFSGVPTGTYFASTTNAAGYIDELYSETPCAGGADFCSVTSGTPIAVTAGQVTENIDFTLAKGGGWFEGAITDQVWGHGLRAVAIDIFDSSGILVSRFFPPRPYPQDGSYRTCGLPAGTYFARVDTTSLLQDYPPELFDGILCAPTCDPTLGAPIVVLEGQATPGIDFTLLLVLFRDDFESGGTDTWNRVFP